MFRRMPSTADRRTARERLLAAADELFYAEGVHTVGIDRVIERAGVAKATLYSAFGSKDALIREYLTRRHQAWQDRVARHIAAHDRPRDRLLAVFDSLTEWSNHPAFNGCAFINAAAEQPPGAVTEEPADAYRAAVRSLFRELAEAAHAAEPERLSTQLALLYDGGIVAARMDRNPRAAASVREIAITLIDAAIADDAARVAGKRKTK